MSNNITHDELKKLYIQKIQAIKKNDKLLLDELRKHHPELFDKRFLYNMIQKELEITDEQIPIELDALLQKVIKETNKMH